MAYVLAWRMVMMRAKYPAEMGIHNTRVASRSINGSVSSAAACREIKPKTAENAIVFKNSRVYRIWAWQKKKYKHEMKWQHEQ